MQRLTVGESLSLTGWGKSPVKVGGFSSEGWWRLPFAYYETIVGNSIPLSLLFKINGWGQAPELVDSNGMTIQWHNNV